MKTTKRKRKLTIRQCVEPAHKVGAQVEISLKPKEVDIDPILRMANDLMAIYHLARSREVEALKSAQILARRISCNEIMFIISGLEKEYWNKPVLERP
jgi:hypothetical protein